MPQNHWSSWLVYALGEGSTKKKELFIETQKKQLYRELKNENQ